MKGRENGDSVDVEGAINYVLKSETKKWRLMRAAEECRLGGALMLRGQFRESQDAQPCYHLSSN